MIDSSSTAPVTAGTPVVYAAMYSASSHTAPLIVIDVFICSIGMPSNNTMSVVERRDRHADLGARERIVAV